MRRILGKFISRWVMNRNQQNLEPIFLKSKHNYAHIQVLQEWTARGPGRIIRERRLYFFHVFNYIACFGWYAFRSSI